MSGGRRPGAGRKKGVPNKRTAERQAAFAASGEATPLDFMLQRMRDESLDGRERMQAAAAAAPYLHPRLASVEAHVSGDLIVKIVHFADGRDGRG